MSNNIDNINNGQGTPEEVKGFGTKVKEGLGKVGKGVKTFVGKTWKFAAGAAGALAVKALLDRRESSYDYDEEVVETETATDED